mmetsp:Transcript_2203/g.7246  ORF Transcript_2203/g.7246 Transcript_2203/m.7246 type:complete len:273 (-) Transcript_2203:486-1304(-)
MLKNFSMPMSAPNPASVTTNPSLPTSLRATWSAMMDELPWAMFAKGPACTSTGVPSRVCISVGLTASFMSTVRAPPMPTSSASTGCRVLLVATTMRPRRSRMSLRLVARASTAMISEATAMSYPVSRVMPFSAGPWPTVILRRKRSFTSTTRFQEMAAGSMSRRAKAACSASVRLSGSRSMVYASGPEGADPSRSFGRMPSFSRRRSITLAKRRLPSFPLGHSRSKRALSFCVDSWNTRVSMAAARRLLAAVIAWMSPVRWRLNSSMGITWA